MKLIHNFAFLLCLSGSVAFVRAGGDKPAAAESGPDAAKLWAQNCSRCHNVRAAVTCSDAQWDVIVHHMRVRGFLTGAESRAIVQFLKEAN